MSRELELLPCPFCGGDPKLVEVEPSGYVVECTNGICNASTNIRFSCGEDARPLVAEQWNRRAALTASPQAAPVLDRPARVAGRDFLPGQPIAQVLGRAYAHYGAQHGSPQAAPDGEWLPMADAPKDGRRVLLRFKDAQALPQRGDGFGGVALVGKWTGDLTAWCFAAPVGMGGFPDDWMAGWQPLPTASPQVQGGEACILCDGNGYRFAGGSRYNCGDCNGTGKVAAPVSAVGVDEAATPGLFAMHLMGPDEIYAAPSYETALRVANAVNVEFADRPVKPYAVVVPWPDDAKAHAAGLADWEGTWN